MLSKIVDDIDSIPFKALLCINLAMGAFVLLAHGGSLALSFLNGENISVLVMVTVPTSLFIILSCVIGFALENIRLKILSIHSIVLLAGAILTFYYGLSLLLKGFPKGNFSWGVGFFTFFCVYPVYFVRRTIFRNFISKSSIIKYFHIFIFIIAFSVDITVFVKGMIHFKIYH